MIHGIEVAATVTIDSDCEISCEVANEQVQLLIGRHDTGLFVYLDWPTLAKLVAVADAATNLARMQPSDQRIDFMVSADANSRREHTPNYPHGGESELLLSDLDSQTGRHHLI